MQTELDARGLPMRCQLPCQNRQAEGQSGDQRRRDQVVAVEGQAGNVGHAEPGEVLRIERRAEPGGEIGDQEEGRGRDKDSGSNAESRDLSR